MRISDWSADVCSSDLTEQQFGDIIIKTGADGEVTRLADVSRIELGAGEYALRSLLDNKSAVALPVLLQPGANALELADNVRSTMAELKKTFQNGRASCRERVCQYV